MILLVFTFKNIKKIFIGELYGIGKNTDNALGLGTWEGNNDNVHWRYNCLQKITFPNNTNIAGVDASLGTSIAWTSDGKFFSIIF